MTKRNEFEIIVVDNNSTDGSKEFLCNLKEVYPELVLILNEENRGTAFGRNSGFNVANGNYILAMDDDTRINVEDVRKLPSLFEKYQEAGLLSFRIVHPGSNDLQNPHGDIVCEIAHHHGACFAFRKEILQSIGGIDNMCDYGGEEPDLAIRFRLQGYSVLYVPEITAMHNSIILISKLEKWRLERRIYHKIRLFYMYFPKRVARKHAIRHLLASLWGWYKYNGFSEIFTAIKAARDGAKSGLSRHKELPSHLVKFYDNPDLQPDFGNIPLYRRISQFLGRRINRK
jgi:GT2 family glycosyltransferase